MFKHLCLALLVVPLVLAETYANQLAVYPECNVCGDGYYVNRPKMEVNDSLAKNTTCGTLQQEGKIGMLKPDFCKALPLALATVGCCRALQPVCNICGDGKYVSKPNVVFDPTNHPDKKCGSLKIEGESGYLTATECTSYQSTLPSICCASDGTSSTSTTPAPTPAQNTHANNPQKGDAPTAPSRPSNVPNKKDPNQAFSSTNGTSTGTSNGLSGGAKAGLGVFLTFVAIGGIFAFLHRATKGTSIRTADTAGATLEPDGSNMKEKPAPYTEGTMDEVDLNTNFATERLVV